MRKILIVIAAMLVFTASGVAQEHQHEEAPAQAAWTWTTDANVFFGGNYQRRLFLDYSGWESQNWFMLGGDGPLGRGRLTFDVMLSLEPFTLNKQGSPQLFQTGESYNRTPLVNYQHPHDLVMGLGATYRFTRKSATYFVGADIVGSPTLGPTPFMHRESGRNNPQVPLAHHSMDSTHITPGVVRAGATIGPFTLESSVFRGEEPDEDRLDIGQPRLDSWAARAAFARGPWRAQFSGGHLRQPEWFEPYNANRYTASLGFDGLVLAHPLKVTAVWGGNREFNGFNGNNDGYLLEWDAAATSASTLYGRAEVVDKELFGLGAHPRGLSHRHAYHKIKAVTVGYLRDVLNDRWGRVGIGADATFYAMPDELKIYWDSSRSFHVFLRWRPRAAVHVH